MYSWTSKYNVIWIWIWMKCLLDIIVCHTKYTKAHTHTQLVIWHIYMCISSVFLIFHYRVYILFCVRVKRWANINMPWFCLWWGELTMKIIIYSVMRNANNNNNKHKQNNVNFFFLFWLFIISRCVMLQQITIKLICTLSLPHRTSPM